MAHAAGQAVPAVPVSYSFEEVSSIMSVMTRDLCNYYLRCRGPNSRIVRFIMNNINRFHTDDLIQQLPVGYANTTGSILLVVENVRYVIPLIIKI